ncbi:ABC transporter ATP-binding protein [Corynebacterium variabile]|jgi:ABC-type multidrug transport system fused ATPase/permease subunit|uniref:ABC-type multidrug transport system, ATPase and permease components n=1 Tax=Corynebacterium variabile TaxID=1727 RepID=A0A0X2NN19_9CORY|nr:ABC transporter ATP-binding protein [Corynebacterium variabile]CUU66882.1 ABC-type multidrug transport system, ATPase and permease components [Corynebacterium variabile]
MLTRLHTVTGGGRTFRIYLLLVVLSTVLQVGAIITLFPLCRDLFSDDPASAGWWVLLMVVLIAVCWVVDILAAHRGLDLGLAVMRRIQRATPDALLAWPESRLTPTMTADLRRLLSQGATEASSSVVLAFTPLATAVIYVFALGVGLLFVHVPAGLVTLVGGTLAMGALWASTRLEARADRQFEEATGEVDSRLFEFAVAQPSLRTGRQAGAGARLVDRAVSGNRSRVLKLLLWQIPGEFLFSLVTQGVLLAFGVVIWRGYDGGSLSAVEAATMVIVLLRVVEQVSAVAGLSAGVNNFNRSLDLAAQVVKTTPVRPVAITTGAAPAVQLDGVDVTFPDGTTGLQDVDLTAAPGSVTVVIGASGSGKTTLLRTLAGLTPPDAGALTLDGTPAGPAELRGSATFAFQHTVLNAGTLRENLLTVNPDLTDADLDRIGADARLTPLLEAAPDGWDTPAGELGAQLSGGERQRVGIARALAKPARVLLIDEATSALDTTSERAVVEAVRRVRDDYTTVIVTHRPAMLDIADRVVVMAGGRVVEAGAPADLEAAGGEYARLLAGWRAAADWQVR